jgi:hypothetical protein
MGVNTLTGFFSRRVVTVALLALVAFAEGCLAEVEPDPAERVEGPGAQLATTPAVPRGTAPQGSKASSKGDGNGPEPEPWKPGDINNNVSDPSRALAKGGPNESPSGDK